MNMYDINIERINLKSKGEVTEVKDFLERAGLGLDKDVDYTLVARKGDEIKGTCSKAKNVLKCFAVSEELRGEGITAKLINHLNDRLFEEEIYHSFIFTKPENIDIFKGVGYTLISESYKVALLESGIYNINSYIDKLKKQYSLMESKERGAIVMNCNPLTLGHLYLIEEAAKQCEELLIFIVEENKSLFPFEDRYDLVKRGTNHISNVKVIKGGEYIISSATFPSYFLREKNDVLTAYTSLDASIFGEYFVSQLNIKKRYIGEEPYCEVTNAYNNSLKNILPKYGVEVIEIKRKEQNSMPISASRVREHIRENQMEKILNLVPKVTYDFLNTEKGKEIVEKIKTTNTPH